MSKGITRSGVVKVALGAGAALAAAWAAIRVVNHASPGELDAYTRDPVRDYDSAIARFAQVQAREEADQALNPVCHSKLLTHGRKVERAIVLMHGMTNCPQQFVDFAPLFYERGYNVLIPRMSHNGLANRDTDALKYVTAEELRDCSNNMVDIARGLGEHVTYAGISMGGVTATWVAHAAPDSSPLSRLALRAAYGSAARQRHRPTGSNVCVDARPEPVQDSPVGFRRRDARRYGIPRRGDASAAGTRYAGSA